MCGGVVFVLVLPDVLLAHPSSVLLLLTFPSCASFRRLTIYEQLVAGARFLDIRVSKLTPAAADDRLWVVHGAAACVPLADVVAQINAFHARAATPTHVILAVRYFRLSVAEAAALATQLNDTLTHPIFRGDAPMLAATPLIDLPVNIVAGVAGVSKLGPGWAVDDWINTYCGERKLAGLHRQLAAAVAGAAAASSLSCAPAAAVDERLACLDALPPSPRPAAAAVGAPLPPLSTLTSSPSSVRSSPGGSLGGSPPPSRPASPPLGGRPRRASAPVVLAPVELSVAAPAPLFAPIARPTGALVTRVSAPAPAARTVTPAPLGPSPEAAAAAARLDALFVLGWTVTPHPTDIALRIASVGRVRPSLITEASRFNARLSPFLADHGPTVGAVVHVLFFDFFSLSIAATVARVRHERAAGGWSVGEADASPSTLLDTAAALEEAPPPPSPRLVSWGRRLVARLRWR